MEEKEIILIGWKSICSACGTTCSKTMKRMFIKYPIRITSFNGKPAIEKEKLLTWFNNLPEKKIKG